jgi:uncharacterized protein (DUF302 family)
MLEYGFTKSLKEDFETLEERVKTVLKSEGFGVLTRIDLKEKFKEKLNVDYKRYVILGACNPPNAYKAIKAEENIGLMLPCNVILYEKDDQTVVSIIKPSAAMGMIDNPALKEIAETVEKQLLKVFESI